MSKFKKTWINTLIELQFDSKGDLHLLNKEGFWYEGPMALAKDTAGFDQDSYRWRDDDGSESAATNLSTNASYDFDVTSGNVDARLRFLIQEINAASENNVGFVLMFQINGGGYAQIGAATTGVIYYDSANLTDGNDTTQQLGSGTFITNNNGVQEDGDNQSQLCSFAGGDEAEFEYTVRFVAADLSDGDSIDFQVWLTSADDLTTQGSPTAGGYTRTANATITKITSGQEIDRTITETSEVTDSPFRTVAATREFLASIGVDDAIIRGMLINRDLIDSIDVNDFVEAWVLRGRVISESVTAADALFAYAAFSRVVAESMDVNDFITTTVAGGLFSVVLTDSFDVSDFALTSVERQKLLQDSANVDDALLASIERLRLVFENAEVVDAINSAREMLRVLVDTLDVNDALRADVLGLMYTVTITEPITLDDILGRAVQLSRAILDSLDASDNILVNISGQLISRIIAENISVSDLIAAGFFHNRILQDVVVAADAIIKTQQLGRTVTDSVQIDPLILRTLIATRLFQENFETTDQLVIGVARLLEVAIKALIDIETSDVVIDIDTLPVNLGIDETIPAFGTNVLATGNLIRATLSKAFLDDNASNENDAYNNNYCYIPSGVAAGRKPRITDYAVSLVKNELLYSRDPSNAAWTQAGSITLAQDQTGLYGEANTAWTIGDSSTTALSQVWQLFTIPDDTNTNCVGVAVLKDEEESHFPMIQVDYFGGSQGVSVQRVMFNTKTGDYIIVQGSPVVSVVDAGDWWVFCVAVANNGTGNTNGLITFYPASGHVWGTMSVFTVGNLVVDLFQVRLNATDLGELIPTTDAPVEETVRVCSVDFDIIPNDTPVYQVLSNVGARS